MVEGPPPAFCPPEYVVPHRWDIEPPNGPESRGVCAYCGSEKLFKKKNQRIQWESTNTLAGEHGQEMTRINGGARTTRMTYPDSL